MKKFLVALAIAATGMSAQAYDVFDNKDNHAYWGVRVSYELSVPGDVEVDAITKQELYKSSSGVSAGVIYNMPLWKNLYFEPGLNLYYNTLEVNKALVKSEFPSAKSASVREFGFRIPLHIGYHFDVIPSLKLSVFTGPEITMGLSGCNHTDFGDFALTHSAYGHNGSMNRFDMQWRFGVGATFLEHYYGAVSGATGICDHLKGPGSMHTSLFDITIGYNF